MANGNLDKKVIKYLAEESSNFGTTMNTNDIDKAYVSPYDKFLFEFDATHNKSESQLKEIAKHARIAKMRDDKDYKDTKGEIWEEF